MLKFFGHFASLIPAGARVVDLGAGDGSLAAKLAAGGTRVIAVDRKDPETKPNGVDWVTSSIEGWLEGLPADFRADAFLLKNVVQFFEKGWTLSVLLPKLASHLSPGGVIGIETFTKAPEPPFPKPHASYYAIEDLKVAFPGWELPLAEEASDDAGSDLAGTRRTFYLTRLIARKPG